MLLPQLVNGAEDGVALDLLERLGILEADLQLVGLADAVGDEVADGELRRAEAVEDRALAPAASLPDSAALTISALRHAEREVQVHPVGQRRAPSIRSRSVSRGGELLDLLDDDLLHDVHEAVAHVGGVDDLVAEAVDDLALLVHHVVVLERALADLEVVLLDALLGLSRWSGSAAGAPAPGLPPGPSSPCT